MRTSIQGLVVALCATFLLLPAPRAEAAGVDVDIPTGTWSGVETVTFTSADPTVQSFAVQIGGAPHPVIRAANAVPGEPVEVQVPTWGFHGRWNVAATGCSVPVDQQCSPSVLYTRTFEQDPADAVAAAFDLPGEPVFLPEEADDARITLTSPGGRHFLVTRTEYGGRELSDLVPAGGSAPLPLAGTGPIDIESVARCPEGVTPGLVRLGTSCEVFPIGRTVTVVGNLGLSVSTSSAGAIIDAQDGTSVDIRARVVDGLAAELSYELLDSADRTVLGPVAWPGTGDVAVFDPNAPGVALAGGDHTLEVTATITKGDLVRTETATVPLALTTDPPPVDLPSYWLSGIARDVRGDRPASVSVGGTNDPRYLGTLHVTDAAGNEVWTARTGPDCRGDSCQMAPDPNEPAWYDFSWPGTTTAGARLRAGEYHAVMTVVDAWGRTVEVADVGSLYIDHLETVTTTKRYTPASTTWADSIIGRCSSSPKPGPHGWAGSVGVLSLSRCRNTAGRYDWAFRSFLLEHRKAPDQQRLISYQVAAYGAPVRRGMRGGIVYDASGGRGPVWKNVGTLSGGLGWHTAARVAAPPGNEGTNYFALVQARTTSGNKWDIRYWRVSWTHRAWRR
ncbi:hypothetical protein BJ993_003913 [Nocardioides aromaticivorans]|uniref:Uncharacterized protein n=1 Tax=Nocardioides aromaticivorans TaxID=200618 RepID=A0A7Y9ZM09_9ACTN|nr:hypothetical protein [Nocardioides aromaticivorans]NYI46833.1 hypothetical protein [Nocardioides aromaticivorans]